MLSLLLNLICTFLVTAMLKLPISKFYLGARACYCAMHSCYMGSNTLQNFLEKVIVLIALQKTYRVVLV